MQNQIKSVCAVIVAAGNSSRMAAGDKLFLDIAGVPTLVRTLLAFQSSEVVDGIVVVTRSESIERVESLCEQYRIDKLVSVTEGGTSRAASVLCGIATARDYDIVLVHDGARPLVSERLIKTTALAAAEYGAAIPTVAVKDTTKIVGKDGFVLSTPARSTLFAVQTPQGFFRNLYEKAADAFEGDLATLTDDSMLFEAAGYRVKTLEGEYTNIKITTDSDVAIAESYLKGE